MEINLKPLVGASSLQRIKLTFWKNYDHLPIIELEKLISAQQLTAISPGYIEIKNFVDWTKSLGFRIQAVFCYHRTKRKVRSFCMQVFEVQTTDKFHICTFVERFGYKRMMQSCEIQNTGIKKGVYARGPVVMFLRPAVKR